MRERAARAVQAVFAELGLPPVTDAEVDAATSRTGAATSPTATGRPTSRRRTSCSRAACRRSTSPSRSTDAGFADVAEAVVGMLRQRVAADYLQTSAVIEPDGLVRSAVNDPNLYLGPGTGYRLEGERWELLQALPHVVDPRLLGAAVADAEPVVEERGTAGPGDDPSEVVVAVGPAFADGLRETIAGLGHDEVLEAVVDGLRGGGAVPRVVRSGGRPTSPSSRTTGLGSPAPGSPSASSRRGRR